MENLELDEKMFVEHLDDLVLSLEEMDSQELDRIGLQAELDESRETVLLLSEKNRDLERQMQKLKDKIKKYARILKIMSNKIQEI